MIVRSDLDACKLTMENYIGSQIRLTSNAGRKRMIVHEGILDCCYPNVFTVRCSKKDTERFEGVVSYSYVDVLTRVVKIVSLSEPSAHAG